MSYASSGPMTDSIISSSNPAVNCGMFPVVDPAMQRPLKHSIRSFHSIHDVVDRGVQCHTGAACGRNLRAELNTVNISLSANHAYLKTLYSARSSGFLLLTIAMTTIFI